MGSVCKFSFSAVPSEARAEFLRVPQSSANCQSRLFKGAEWGLDE